LNRQLTLRGSGRMKAAGAEFEFICRRCTSPFNIVVERITIRNVFERHGSSPGNNFWVSGFSPP